MIRNLKRSCNFLFNIDIDKTPDLLNFFSTGAVDAIDMLVCQNTISIFSCEVSIFQKLKYKFQIFRKTS